MENERAVVRRAGREDAETLLGLIQALADYEQLPGPEPAARERLVAHGWPTDGEPRRFSAWIAELTGAHGPHAVGYAITFETYSTFLARPTLYIEDLFVLPDRRRAGVGNALFARLVEEARERGCGRIEWVVLDWNTSAQQFYQRLGARHLTEWQTYRLQMESEGAVASD